MAQAYTMTTAGALGHRTGSAVSGGTFTVTSTAATSVKVDGNGVYKSPINFTFANGNAVGFVNGSVHTVSPQSIDGGPTSVKVDGADTMNEGDWAAVTMWGTPTGAGPPPDTTVPGATVEVASAGQTNVEND